MAKNGIVPPVTVKGARVPIERLAGYSPNRSATTPGYGTAISTASREAALVLASRTRAVLRTARPFVNPIIPGRRVG